jgi:hypothetical protein
MKYRIVDGEVKQKFILYTFTIGDVDDLDIYIAQPIYEWQQTPAGKWCMKHATDLEYHTQVDHMTMGHRVVITGFLKEKDNVWRLLAWG